MTKKPDERPDARRDASDRPRRYPSRRARRGFIVIFGHRTVTRADPRPAVEATCPACREQATLRGKYARVWFTLFFIPVFPMESMDAAIRFTQCSACKSNLNLTLDQLARQATSRPGNDHASAIALYNELRDNPTDSTTLLRLLTIYDAMDELREAESSCRAFPAACTASPACGELMTRLRARLGDATT